LVTGTGTQDSTAGFHKSLGWESGHDDAGYAQSSAQGEELGATEMLHGFVPFWVAAAGTRWLGHAGSESKGSAHDRRVMHVTKRVETGAP
jgi:hypothetical protein